MKCPHCGVGNPEAGKFCRSCGKPLETHEEKKAELTEQLAPVGDGKHSDLVCPYCGGTDCQPVSRTTGTAKGGGYNIGNGCCGMCMLGPFGLLCGLCGTKSKIDLKNETVWVCRSCGKVHLSQKDALAKAFAMAVSLGTWAAVIALILSFAVNLCGWSWLFAAAWAFSPLVVRAMVDVQISDELGYPMREILPPNVSIPVILVVAEIIMVLILWKGGPLVNDFVEGL